MATWIGVLDLFGVAVFAVTGALVASRKQMDIVGFATELASAAEHYATWCSGRSRTRRR